MSYSDVVMRHFGRPTHQHVMERPDVVGVAGVPGQGPFLVLYLRLDERGRVSEASFQTNGCAPSIAAGSLLATELPGSTPREAAARWSAGAIEQALGGLPPHKAHCSALAAAALARCAALATSSTNTARPEETST